MVEEHLATHLSLDRSKIPPALSTAKSTATSELLVALIEETLFTSKPNEEPYASEGLAPEGVACELFRSLACKDLNEAFKYLNDFLRREPREGILADQTALMFCGGIFYAINQDPSRKISIPPWTELANTAEAIINGDAGFNKSILNSETAKDSIAAAFFTIAAFTIDDSNYSEFESAFYALSTGRRFFENSFLMNLEDEYTTKGLHPKIQALLSAPE